MSNTKFQFKRTTVSGRLPNTTNSANTSYIDAGEFAINLTDGKVVSSNGTATFEVGANLSSLNVGSIFATSNVTISNSAVLIANGSFGTNSQVLISNGTGMYWGNVAIATVNTSIVTYTYNIASNTTVITGADNNSNTLSYYTGLESVYLNGSKLIAANDYTTTNTSTITLSANAVATDVVQIVAITPTVVPTIYDIVNTLSIGNSTVNTTINATSFSGTANNANNLGGTSLATLQNQITGNAATAYSNAVANAGWYADQAYSNAVANAAALYQTTAGLSANVLLLASNTATYLGNSSGTIGNVTNWITGNAATAYSNASTKADNAYSNAIANASYMAGQAYSNAAANASYMAGQAYTNATTFAANASNLSGGTVSAARLGTDTANSTTILYGNGVWAVAPASTNTAAQYTWTNNHTFSANVSLVGGTIANTPVYSTDIVNKSYADAIATGVNFHPAVRLTTTVSFDSSTATYYNGPSSDGVGATITDNAPYVALSLDSVTASANDRILIRTSTNTAWNGVYVVSNTGSASYPWIITRSYDYDQVGAGTNEIDKGDLIYVTSGSTLAGTSWVENSDVTTIGTDPITFVQFSSKALYALSAGDGLYWSTGGAFDGSAASTIAVNTTYISTLTVNAATYVGNNLGTISNITGWITGNAATAYTNAAANASYMAGQAYSNATIFSSNASTINSGSVGTARLGSGTANSSTILYGNSVWAAAPSSTNASALITGTVNTAVLGSGTANSTTILYGNNVWAAPASAGGNTIVTTGTGSNQAITLSSATIVANDIIVTINGLRQTPNSYVVTSGTLYATAPSGSDIIVQLAGGPTGATGATGAPGNPVTIVKQQFTGDGANTQFAVTGGYTAGAMTVFVNGVKQLETTDVITTSGANIAFVTAPGSGYKIDAFGYIGVPPVTSNTSVVSQQFTANGTGNTFAVSGGYTVGTLQVFVNGVKYVESSDVVTTSGANINFTTPPTSGSIIDVFGQVAFPPLTPSYLPIIGGTLSGTVNVGSNVSITTTGVNVGSNVSITTTGVNVGSNVSINSTAIAIGSNVSITSTGIYINNFNTITTNYLLLPTDYIIQANNSLTLTLMAASTVTGKQFYIRNINTSDINIVGNTSSETINGYANIVMQFKNSSLGLISTGSSWIIN